jgi:transcriptional regulator with XRE-family HTH domain
MKYSEILSNAISESGLKLDKIAEMVGGLTGSMTTKNYLSRLQNGKTPPAGDKLNEALAQILEIDPLDLKTAAYQEKIPADVLEKIKKTSTA